MLGCGGFVGSHLLDRLLQSPNVSIQGWDVSEDKIRHHVGDPRLTLHLESFAEVSAVSALEGAIREADVVVNLAAICNPSHYNTRPISVIRSNFSDLAPVVETCARTRTWLLHFSTSEVYGRTLASYVTPGVYDESSLFELERTRRRSSWESSRTSVGRMPAPSSCSSA